MKKLLLLLLISVTSIAYAQKTDYEQIEKVLWYYLDGDTNKNYGQLKHAFHKNATLTYVSSKNGYTEYNALEAFKGIIGQKPDKNRINRIEYINISGKSANAKIEVEYPTVVIVDYMNLLKIDGKWLIVNKIFSKKTDKKAKR